MTSTRILPKVADGLVAALKAAQVPWTVQFDARRSYADIGEPLEEVATGSEPVRIDVVPVNNPETALETRGSVNYKAAADIVVRRKFSTEYHDAATGEVAQEHIDELIEFVLQIHETMLGVHLLTYPEASWESTDVRAAYIARHLREWRQFTGIVRIGFSVSVPTSNLQ